VCISGILAGLRPKVTLSKVFISELFGVAFWEVVLQLPQRLSAGRMMGLATRESTGATGGVWRSAFGVGGAGTGENMVSRHAAMDVREAVQISSLKGGPFRAQAAVFMDAS
jgi:hypothetical protein